MQVLYARKEARNGKEKHRWQVYLRLFYLLLLEDITLNKLSKTNVSVTGLDAIKNISLTFEWSANDSKATFDNSSLSSTYVFNNYKGTCGATTSSANVSVYYVIKAGSLTISKISKTIKFKRGVGK